MGIGDGRKRRGGRGGGGGGGRSEEGPAGLESGGVRSRERAGGGCSGGESSPRLGIGPHPAKQGRQLPRGRGCPGGGIGRLRSRIGRSRPVIVGQRRGGPRWGRRGSGVIIQGGGAGGGLASRPGRGRRGRRRRRRRGIGEGVVEDFFDGPVREGTPVFSVVFAVVVVVVVVSPDPSRRV